MTSSVPGRGFAFAGRSCDRASCEGEPLTGTVAPTMVETGEVPHQLYAQVSFRWHSVYMGIAMVYDAADPVYNRVHCRLVWAHPSEAFAPAAAAGGSNGSVGGGGWRWVDPGGLTGRDFIPLNSTVPAGQNAFDSHLCYAAPPVHTPDGERTPGRVCHFKSDNPILNAF